MRSDESKVYDLIESGASTNEREREERESGESRERRERRKKICNETDLEVEYSRV